MKILHVITSLHMGGAEKLMVDILPRLNCSGMQCELLTFNGEKTPFREKLEKMGIKIIDLGNNRNPYHPKNLFRLISIIKNYDIIHTHNTAPQLFAAISSIFTSNIDLITTEHNTSNRRRDWRWFKPIDKWMYSKYKVIICISDKTKDKLLEYLPNLKTPLTVINNGIPIDEYKNAEPNEPILKEYKGIKKLVMVAGFRYQKDQITVIRAMQYLPINYHLFLVGDGVERRKAVDLAFKLDVDSRVHFLGKRDDVPSILKCADICILSSHWEGFGLAAVEGMAAGKPVIASNVPGLAEVVKGAGILFELGNPKDLSEKILSLMSNNSTYQIVSERCRDRAFQYDIERMVKGYVNVYRKENNIL